MRPSQPPAKEGYFCVGVIIGAHGIKGEVTIKPFTEVPADINAYGVPCDLQGTPFVLSALRPVKKGVIVKVEHSITCNDAEALKGTYLYAMGKNLPELGDEEAYLTELKGMQVVREDGSVYGLIIKAFIVPSNSVIEVEVEGLEETVLLPFIDDVIVKMKRRKNQVIVSEMADQFLDL